MTAEVAVMNKLAVALAADSAVTTGQKSGLKVFNTANKLFALSKYKPVGIMIFGSAEFMVVPWETIIKYYRSRLGKTSFASLAAYAEHFLGFLEREANVLWPPPVQERWFREIALSYFQVILKELNAEVSKQLEGGGVLQEEQIESIAAAAIRRHRERWDNAPMVPSAPDDCPEQMKVSFESQIRQAREEAFQKVPLTPSAQDDLVAIAAQLFCKQIFPPAVSGLVIAGFGEAEIFPSAVSYVLEAVVMGKLKYRQDNAAFASRDTPAIIIPFAQQEMVRTFIEGIDPSFRETIEAYLQKLVAKYPRQILEAIPEIPEERREAIAQSLGEVGGKVVGEFQTQMNRYVSDHHVNPVLSAVAALPKDELAAMAEALVNLTSFKRRVTLETETVGGPIDVAVISKGDGFIWIKRKHYFGRDLNQGFFANYYREKCDGREGNEVEPRGGQAEQGDPHLR